MSHTELEQSLKEAENLLDKVRRERAKMEHDHKQAANERIERMLNEIFELRIKDIHTMVVAAKELVDEERTRIALTGKDAPFPLNTKMVHWELRQWGREQYKTGGVGIVEAVTKDCVHSDNIAAYSMAPIGSYVIRILRKDGTPSKKYKKFTRYYDKDRWSAPWGWHPEGVTPKE